MAFHIFDEEHVYRRQTYLIGNNNPQAWLLFVNHVKEILQ